MVLLESINQLDKNEKVSLTMGNFDGVHLGHKNILDNLKKISKDKNTKSLVILFEPQPMEFFLDNPPTRILKLEDKISLIEKQNIDYLLVLNFSDCLANTKADDFICYLFKNINILHIHIGDDFHFGKNREGNFDFLLSIKNKYKFTLSKNKSLLDYNNQRVSSTIIRDLLHNGDLAAAKLLLGYDYFIHGIVKKGKQFGRTIGIPTINLEINNIPPIHGVYFTKVKVGCEYYYGISNVGYNPTIDNNKSIKCETYLYNFSADVYYKEVYVYFLEKIRDEKKFNNVDELILNIKSDIDVGSSLIIEYLDYQLIEN